MFINERIFLSKHINPTNILLLVVINITVIKLYDIPDVIKLLRFHNLDHVKLNNFKRKTLNDLVAFINKDS